MENNFVETNAVITNRVTIPGRKRGPGKKPAEEKRLYNRITQLTTTMRKELFLCRVVIVVV